MIVIQIGFQKDIFSSYKDVVLFCAKQDNLAGDNLAAQICQQANLSASQFGGKINKNDLPLLALKQQQKFCYVTKAIEKTIVIVQLIRAKILIKSC